ITQDLGHTLDLDPLLGKLLDHLLRLFPQADRGMVLVCEPDRSPTAKPPPGSPPGTPPEPRLVVRAQRTRHKTSDGDFPYSRTIVRKALEEGVGLLSEDVRGDRNLPLSATMVSLNLRSFLCVPLIGWEKRRLGVIQLDSLRAGQSFKQADLEMLTAIGLQASVVLQNPAHPAQP